MDFVSDSLASGRRIKCLTVTHDFSHECVDIAVDHGIGGEYVVRVLDQVARFRGYPQAVRSDQGREFTSGAFMAWALEHLPGWLIRPFILSFLTTALGLTDKLFLQGAMLVNRRGGRFCDEFDKPVWKLAEQPQQSGYVVLDRKLAEEEEQRRNSGTPWI